jgi:CTP synthase (UTP-ammonia lyase)
MNALQIGIIADYNPKSRYHVATDAALQHAAGSLSLSVESIWLETDQLNKPGGYERLKKCAGLFCGPGSPYRSMEGALNAIRFAREQGYPFIGT